MWKTDLKVNPCLKAVGWNHMPNCFFIGAPSLPLMYLKPNAQKGMVLDIHMGQCAQ